MKYQFQLSTSTRQMVDKATPVDLLELGVSIVDRARII